MFFEDMYIYYLIRFIEVEAPCTLWLKEIPTYQEEYFEDNKHAKRIVARHTRKLSYQPRIVTNWNKR